MTTHSSTLAWKMPWTEEPGRLQSMWFPRSRTRLSDFPFTFHFHALEKEMATHTSTFAWRIPGTRAWWAAIYGVTQGRTRLSDFSFTFHFPALEKEMATHSSVLAWRIPGMGSLMGCCLWGRTESDTTEAT